VPFASLTINTYSITITINTYSIIITINTYSIIITINTYSIIITINTYSIIIITIIINSCYLLPKLFFPQCFFGDCENDSPLMCVIK
jgi:hypothetical protein